MLSQRAKSLKPSPTLALNAKAKQLKSEGNDVISLSVGEPDWDTYDNVKQAGVDSIQRGETKYVPSNGTPALREAIAKQTSDDLGVSYSPDDVTVSVGGKFVLFSAMQMVLNPGDEVIIPAPYWVSYPTMAELAGAIPRVVVCDQSVGFKLTADLLRQNIDEKTKLLVLSSPSNPTGLIYTKEELAEIAEVVKEHPQLVVLSDDIYNRLILDGSDLAPHILHVAPELKDRVIVTNGVAKSYSMTGWRVGWALGPKEVISAMTKYQSQSVSCTPGFCQAATVAAINDSQDQVKQSVKELIKRRDLAVSEFNAIPGVKLDQPEGAFYVWPDVSSFFGKSFNGKVIQGSHDFAGAFLEDQMVAVVPGKDFGLEGYVRVSYALGVDRMQEAFRRFKEFVAKLD